MGIYKKNVYDVNDVPIIESSESGFSYSVYLDDVLINERQIKGEKEVLNYAINHHLLHSNISYKADIYFNILLEKTGVYKIVCNFSFYKDGTEVECSDNFKFIVL